MQTQRWAPGIDLRDLFDGLVELAPKLRDARLSELDLPEDVRLHLQAMFAFDDMVALAPGERAAQIATRKLPKGVSRRLHAMLAIDGSAPVRVGGSVAETFNRICADDDELLGQSLVGTHIGTFRLLALIGQGSSSAVFRAERQTGEGLQIVALKLLRTGLYSNDAWRRFRREQAILARLRHPNIAGLIEGGVSSAGIPYIAMELVEGAPITHAARARGLSVEQRLAWFSRLCRTVAAVHAALIVHCDLKPANLFVTQNDELKVLDFGIAKRVDDVQATRTQPIALTPEYAAPEQFGPGPLTAAVDVYALGVVLGELLTGQRLVGTKRASDAVAAAINDKTTLPNGLPPRPALIRKLRGDLDAILASALADEPAMRFGSAGALADTIERYLDGHPVRTRAPSHWCCASLCTTIAVA